MKCPYVMKKCTKCGEILHISRYHKDKNCKYKVRNICKECQKKIGKSYIYYVQSKKGKFEYRTTENDSEITPHPLIAKIKV